MILAIPFTGGASAAAALAAGTIGGATLGASVGAIDASSRKDDFEISDEFVKKVGTMVQPGDSAIFALLRTLDPTIVAERFRGYGGTILRTTLSTDELRQLDFDWVIDLDDAVAVYRDYNGKLRV